MLQADRTAPVNWPSQEHMLPRTHAAICRFAVKGQTEKQKLANKMICDTDTFIQESHESSQTNITSGHRTYLELYSLVHAGPSGPPQITVGVLNSLIGRHTLIACTPGVPQAP